MRKKKPSRILEAIYETAVDLHSCGAFTDEQMKQYEELTPVSIPVNLDKDVFDFLSQKCDFDAEKLRVLINDWLRKDIEIVRSVSS